MMRTFLVFGFTALYIACAFVPPWQANFRTFAAKAQELYSSDGSEVFREVSRNTSASVLIDTAMQAAASVAPTPTKVLETVTRVIAGTPDSGSSLPALLAAEQNSALHAQFERILWASSKSDPRLCKVLLEFPDAGMPTHGDLLALCLAETTGEAARCHQINDISAPSLLQACRNDLEIQI